jgi:hypothetical protein
MTEVLTQAEIDQLLTAIVLGFESIKEFEKYLTKRAFSPEKPYGHFGHQNISVCRFFNSENNDNVLSDIMKKNEEQGLGNIKVPNTNITLINYSFCPKCRTIFSFKEVIDYYRNPRPDAWYKNKANQFRNDTRVYCYNCDSYFLPSLIISDGTPRNEVQFLCRVQTINAVEKYMLSKNIRVLTKEESNIVYKDKLRAIKNDVSIKDLEKKPTLITNIIQYTPYNLIMNFIDGTNIGKGDLLFDEWKEAS